MLKTQYREGTLHSSPQVIDISPPEGNCKALAALCYVLHNQPLPYKPRDATWLLSFATVAEKYRCVPTIKPLRTALFEGIDLSTFQPDIADVVQAPYLLDDPEYLQKSTDSVVRRFRSHFFVGTSGALGLGRGYGI